MQPIPPPPRRPRSRSSRATGKIERNKQKKSSMVGGSGVKYWVPFGDELRSASSDSNDSCVDALDTDVTISASWSGDSDETGGGIEMELSNWNSSPSVDQQSLSDLALIPLPTQNNAPIADSTSAMPPTTRTPNNRKIVKTKGLAKRTPRRESISSGDAPSSDATRETRGRSDSHPSRARSKSRTSTPRSFTAVKVKRKEDKPSLRSRSIGMPRALPPKPIQQERDYPEEEVAKYASVATESNQVQALYSGQNDVIAYDVSFDETSRSAGLEEHPIASTPVNAEAGNSSICLPRPIYTRNLLTTSVYNNQATGIWITTINMSQKESVTKSNAAKYLKAFSFQTEREARESAYANAPAKMLPFDENHFCFACSGQFSVFKRAAHCRNCGVCICNTCSVSWSKLCIPETYNIKGAASVKVCKACNSLSNMFRRSLLEANYEDALTIYNTGNVNLRCPFMTNKGGEAMLPIHCAAEGGSLELLQWLVDVHFCPLKRIRTGNRNKTQHSDELITTSKGRSVLEIAMVSQNVDILRYLVNEKSIEVSGVKDLSVALKALEAVLKASHIVQDEQNTPIQRYFAAGPQTPELNRINDRLPSFDDDYTDSDDESPKHLSAARESDDEQSVATTVQDAVSHIHIYTRFLW